MQLKYDFQRKEQKFLLTKSQAAILKQKLAAYLDKEEHSKCKLSSVRSTYFDNADWKLFHEHNLDLRPRFKIRMRQYGCCRQFGKRAFLEIKEKYESLTMKKRFVFRKKWLHHADSLPWNALRKINCEMDPQYLASVTEQISSLIRNYRLEPLIQVDYEREAFECPSLHLRATFDSSLSFMALANRVARPQRDRFDMPDSYHILELKLGAPPPPWLLEIMNRFHLKNQRFSKYIAAVTAVYGPPIRSVRTVCPVPQQREIAVHAIRR